MNNPLHGKMSNDVYFGTKYKNHNKRLKDQATSDLLDYFGYVKTKIRTWKRERSKVTEIIRERTGRTVEQLKDDVREGRYSLKEEEKL